MKNKKKIFKKDIRNIRRKGKTIKWRFMLFPLLLTGCLALSGISLRFPAGSILPGPFLSAPATVYAAAADGSTSVNTDSGDNVDENTVNENTVYENTVPENIEDENTVDEDAVGENTEDDFQTDAAVRSAQPELKEGDEALAPADEASDQADVQTEGSDAEPGPGPDAEPQAEETGETQKGLEEGNTDQTALSGRDRMLPDGEIPDDDLRVGDGDPALPAWYPKDPSTFPLYHDENAPRVIDIADVFSDEEEQKMEARLAELRASLGKDIVILADVSTYGLSRSVYAADFYDFNGYGIGPDREGACLMICMEPGNRGWWCCCTGPVTRGLYNEIVANQIDDMLYVYMKAGEYGAGVADWIENFRRLYTTGSPYSEEWAVMNEASFDRFHDTDAPRVIDDAMILSDSEIGRLTQKAAALSDKYGIDVVIHTARSQGILDRDTYSRKYYLFHGYGFSEEYDGIQLTIFKRPGYTGGSNVYGSGKGLKKLSGVNKSRLEDRCDSLVTNGEYYEGASQWLDQAGHMLRTGRAPRSSASWGFTTVLEMLAGLIFGSFSLGKAKAGMATPKVKENANSYIVKKSIRIRNVADRYLDSTVNRVYSPLKRESSDDGGSGGGSSTFDSSYSGSSGSSHSGSGRDF